MRATVYVWEKRSDCWEARLSIAWEVDMLWLKSLGTGKACLRLKEPLPFGIAEECCRLMGAALNGSNNGKSPVVWTVGLVAQEMKRAVKAAWAAAEENETSASVEVERVELKGERSFSSAELERLALAAEQAGACLQGRSLLREEAASMLAEAVPTLQEGELLRALQLSALRGAVRLAAAIAPRAAGAGKRRRPGLRCRRCGSGEERMRRTRCASCGRSGCAVCEACATLGRSRECELLALGAEQPGTALAALPPALTDRWGLSPAQRSAAEAALRFLREADPRAGRSARRGIWPAALRSAMALATPLRSAATRAAPPAAPARSFLLWAVTGAGKTEMIFPLLDAVLQAGGRALIATPRRDVVLELAPRLQRAFPDAAQAVLYGGSGDRWSNAPLTIATTHQLLRFEQAFDLVLVDELDAFPFHNDPVLHHAAAKACRENGATVLLSATPPARLRREVRRGGVGCARVPVRYHRHPLPTPRSLRLPDVHKLIRQRELPSALKRVLAPSVRRGAQLFVFVPYIKHVPPLVRLLRDQAAALGVKPLEIEGTYSSDPERAFKVQQFRQTHIRILVTTTILERGVTIPRSDVFILGAHRSTFDEASLVQMAGRAGRSAEDPHGLVFFCSPYLTSSQRLAVRQIRVMNRIARRRGYLREKEELA